MQETGRKTVTLVLGGVRSGKSRWAQECATKAERVAYIATAFRFLSQLPDIIASLFKPGQHCAAYAGGSGPPAGNRVFGRGNRRKRPSHQQTFEEPPELGEMIADNSAAFDEMLI